MILSSVTNGIYVFGTNGTNGIYVFFTPSESRYLSFHLPNVIYLNTCCRSLFQYEFE